MYRLRGIEKSFGALRALGPVDLDIAEGEWLGLFGHNGSGKTTLIRILLGLTPPSAGTMTIDGEPPTAQRWRRMRRQLGVMPERVQFYEGMTGREILAYFARLRDAAEGRVEQLLDRVNLEAAADRKVGEYSKGMRQRLNLAQALLGKPRLLVLDEPVEGLDPVGVRSLFGLLREEGVPTVVIASHLIAEVSRQVDRVCILDDGRVRAIGTVAEVTAAMAAPVVIHVHTSGERDDAIEALLIGAGARKVAQGRGRIVVEIAPRGKAALIFAMHALREHVRDLIVEERGIENFWSADD
jgi:Cu-processing system ATP-binding protein